MITKVRFKDFRGFRDLELDGLQRVNLIVGPNNCGKTSLLEGLCLLCEPEKAPVLAGRLRPQDKDTDSRYYRWLLRDGADAAGVLQATSTLEERPVLNVAVARLVAHLPVEALDGPWESNANGRRRVRWPEVYKGSKMHVFAPQAVGHRCCIISAENRPAENLVDIFGKAQRRKEGEESLTQLLRQVDPRIRKIRIDPDKKGNQIIVDVGLSELLPLTQLGQGVQRLVAILSEVIGDKPGVALIDEIENGLHHAVQEAVWTGLAAMAESLDVQVFATTHSKECLEAAHAAFAKRESYDFGVIQLFRTESGPQGRVLDRELIEAAVTSDIDLR